MKAILRRLFRRSSMDADVREELESHVAMRAELNRESGKPPEEALRDARRRFGNSRSIAERLHEFYGFGWLDALVGDMGYAVRGFRRNPGVSLTAVLTIAVGVSAATGMFGVMRNLVLAPPPHVAAPERVFRIHQTLWDDGQEGEPGTGTSYPFFQRLAERADTLEDVAIYRTTQVAAGAGTDARMTEAVMVSPGFWRTLGVRPALGRFFDDVEAHPATGSRVVVLGHGFWQSRFGGRPEAVGQTLRIKGQPYRIVGIAPRGFRGVELATVDLWLPMFAREDGSGRPVTWHTVAQSYTMTIVARVRPGVTAEASAEELTELQRAFLLETYAPMVLNAPPPRNDPSSLERYRRARVRLGPVTGGLGDDLRPIREARVATWLFGMSVVVVAIACSNVAGILLLRAMRRRREIAVRLALGISRSRLARQLLTESLMLAVIGGVAGLLAVVWSGAWLQRAILPAVAWNPSSLIHPSVLGIAALSTLASALAAGMAPFGYARAGVLTTLREGTRDWVVRRSRLQFGLLALQGALSVTLLIGAGLFVRSLYNLETMDVGYDRDQALVIEVDFSGTGRSESDVANFFDQARERTAAIPGITDASLSTSVPLRVASASVLRIPGRDSPPSAPPFGLPFAYSVTPEFFETTGMNIVEGRAFNASDRGGDPVVVVNERLARIGWPDQSPVGKCVNLPFEGQSCATVVGVVSDARSFTLLEDDAHMAFFRLLPPGTPGRRVLLVRLAPGSGRIDATIRDALREIDSGVPFVKIETLGEALDPEIEPWRLGAAAFTSFGLIAIALAMVGLWSSVSYAVSQRRHEFAVRLAVGATRRALVRLVLDEGLRNAVVATAAGVVISIVAGRFIADLLFGVSPRDPLIFASIATGVLTVSLLASLIPARRAWRIHPAEVLRNE